MKKFFFIFVPFLACLISTSTQAADDILVTVINKNRTHVWADLRLADNTKCLAQEYKILSNEIQVIRFNDVAPACRNAKQYTLSASGTSHLFYHADTFSRTPAVCTITHNNATIEVNCRG